MEGVQCPRETVYMPHSTPHAVYNTGDYNVAIGDNPLFPTAIEESAFQLHHLEYNGYAYINNSQIYVHKGSLYPKNVSHYLFTCVMNTLSILFILLIIIFRFIIYYFRIL